MSRWPQEAHLTKIKTLFSKFGGQTNEADTDFITFPMFEEKINTPEVRDYFESLRLVAWFKQVLLIFAHVHQLKHGLAASKTANHTCSADFSVRIFFRSTMKSFRGCVSKILVALGPGGWCFAKKIEVVFCIFSTDYFFL